MGMVGTDAFDDAVSQLLRSRGYTSDSLDAAAGALYHTLVSVTGRGFSARPNSAGETVALCPLHHDHDPSLCVNLHMGVWWCPVCGRGGDFAGLLQALHPGESWPAVRQMQADIILRHPAVGTLKDSPLYDGLDARPLERDVMAVATPREAQDRLAALMKVYRRRDPSSIQVLADALRDHGFPDPEEVVEALDLGLSEERLVWPIYDQVEGQRRLVDLKFYFLRYKEEKKLGKPRFPKWQHIGRRLGGEPEVLWSPEAGWDAHTEVVVCAGEWDCARAWRAGLHAVTGTSGEGNFSHAWGPRFVDKRVVVLYDHDEAGRKGSNKAQEVLRPHASSVEIVFPQKPTGETPDGYDLCDYLQDELPLADLVKFDAQPLEKQTPVDELYAAIESLKSSTEDQATKMEAAEKLVRKLASKPPSAKVEVAIREIKAATGFPVGTARSIMEEERRKDAQVRVPRPVMEEVQAPGRLAQTYDYNTGTLSYGFWLPTGTPGSAWGGGWDSLQFYTVTATNNVRAPVRESQPDPLPESLPAKPYEPQWSCVPTVPYNLFAFRAGKVAPADLDTDTVVSALVDEFSRHFWFASRFYPLTLALWTMHTYLYEAFDATGYLSITGKYQSGKSNLLTLLANLSFRGKILTSITPATVFRTVDAEQPTMGIDEAQKLLSTAERSEAAEEIMSILRGGYKKGSYVDRCEGESRTVRRFTTYGPKMLAATEVFETMLADRCIQIHTERRPKTDVAPQQFLVSLHQQRWQEMRNRLYCWALTHCFEVAASRDRAMAAALAHPGGDIRDRRLENWLPVLTVGEMGGPVVFEQALRAAAALNEEKIATQRQYDKETAEILALWDLAQDRVPGAFRKVEPGGAVWVSADDIKRYLSTEIDQRYQRRGALISCIRDRLGVSASDDDLYRVVAVESDLAGKAKKRCYRLDPATIKEKADAMGVTLD